VEHRWRLVYCNAVFSEVDNNTEYDALEQLSRDAEDKYFNDDDSETSNAKSQTVADYDF